MEILKIFKRKPQQNTVAKNAFDNNAWYSPENKIYLHINSQDSIRHLSSIVQKFSLESRLANSTSETLNQYNSKITTLFWIAQKYAMDRGVDWKVNYIWDASLVYGGHMGWSVFSFESGRINHEQLITEAFAYFLQVNNFKAYKETKTYFSAVKDSVSFNELEGVCHKDLNLKLNVHDFKSIVRAFNSFPNLKYFFQDHINNYTPEQQTVNVYADSVGFLSGKYKIVEIKDYITEKVVKVRVPTEDAPKYEEKVSNESFVTLIEKTSSNRPIEHKQKASWEHLISTLTKPIKLSPAKDDIVSLLRLEFPWAENVCKEIENKLSLSKYVNQKYFKLPPILLVGLPGCGKTRFAKRLAEISGVNHLMVSGPALNGGMMLNGLEQGWGNADSSSILKSIATWKEANPLFIFDEIDKASSNKDWSLLGDSLLAFLDPVTSESILDSFLMTNVNYSYCNWIAIANDISQLSAPLLSRFIVLNFNKPSREHIEAIAKQTRIDVAKQFKINPEILPIFNDVDMEKLKPKAGQNFSAREVRVNCENLLAEKAKNSQRTLNLVTNNQ